MSQNVEFCLRCKKNLCTISDVAWMWTHHKVMKVWWRLKVQRKWLLLGVISIEMAKQQKSKMETFPKAVLCQKHKTKADGAWDSLGRRQAIHIMHIIKHS